METNDVTLYGNGGSPEATPLNFWTFLGKEPDPIKILLWTSLIEREGFL